MSFASIVAKRKRVFAPHVRDGRTKADYANVVDVNEIMKAVKKTGVVTHLARVQPYYGDQTIVGDLHAALNQAAKARESFESLPAKVREYFRNDPIRFVEACSTLEGCRELEKLGVLSITDIEKLKKDAEAKQSAESELLQSLKKAADAAGGGVSQPAKTA